jgi:hypothetical protein
MDRSPVPGPAVEREGRGNNDGSTSTFPSASNSALISAFMWVISSLLQRIVLFLISFPCSSFLLVTCVLYLHPEQVRCIFCKEVLQNVWLVREPPEFFKTLL